MDSNKAKKLRRKRKSERKEADASKNKEYQTDKISQEETSPQNGQKKKRKRLNDTTSNDATTDANVSNGDSKEKALSKRQLKKKKAAQAEIDERESRKVHAMQKAHNYILTWKNCRSEWKFEKLKQIWLMDNLMNEHSISNKMFPIVLEYFEDCKGKARKVLVQKAMENIRKAEEEEDEELKKDILKSTAYNRARELLQILPYDKEF